MPGYYKTAILGTYQGQNIVNILYYGDDAGDAFPAWDEDYAADLGDGLPEHMAAEWLAALPDTYAWGQTAVTFVDQRGVTLSPYTVLRVGGGNGASESITDGAYQAAVLSFNTAVASGAALNVKRSYLAYGPVIQGQIGNNGALGATFATQMAVLLPLLVAKVASTLGEFTPVRVGRTVAPAPIRVGRAVACTLRPFATVRKSRKLTPRGT